MTENTSREGCGGGCKIVKEWGLVCLKWDEDFVEEKDCMGWVIAQ